MTTNLINAIMVPELVQATDMSVENPPTHEQVLEARVFLVELDKQEARARYELDEGWMDEELERIARVKRGPKRTLAIYRRHLNSGLWDI